MQSCRELTVPHTGCGVTSAFIDTPSSPCLHESPVSMTYNVGSFLFCVPHVCVELCIIIFLGYVITSV